MFLTISELRELTGLKRPSAVARWLTLHDYPHEIGADGWPRVLHSFVQAKLGAPTQSQREPKLRLVHSA